MFQLKGLALTKYFSVRPAYLYNIFFDKILYLRNFQEALGTVWPEKIAKCL